MIKLNLPEIDCNIRKNEGKFEIFDIVRRKFIRLTPEEWVRQHFIHFLIYHRNFPRSLIKVESGLRYNDLQKRSDIVIYNRNGQPFLVVECKSFDLNIRQSGFDQVAIYGKQLNSKFLVVSNGLKHYCCEYDMEAKQMKFVDDIPFHDEK